LKDDPVEDNDSAGSDVEHEDQGPNKAQKTNDDNEVPILTADKF